MAHAASEPEPPGLLTDPQDLYGLIQIRWLLAGVLAVGGIATWLAGTITTPGFISALPLIAAIALYNLGFLWVLRAAGVGPDRARWRTLVRWLQQPCDILIITFVLHLIPTGGITPLAILYCAAILAAVVILPPRGVYAITGFAIVCYTALVVYEFYLRPLPPSYTLLYYLRTSPNAARIGPNAVVMMVLAMACVAPIAARFSHRLRADTAQNRRQLADLTALHRTLRELALRDSLTGILNHGALVERLEAAVAEAAAPGGAVALILLDLDGFKAFNDRWGHQAGDAALTALGATLEASVGGAGRAAVGRWGGEEFGVVLPGATHAEALALAERIRTTLAAVVLVGPAGQPWPTPTASQGLACFPQDASTAPALVAVADEALYEAKAQGRDCIVAGPPRDLVAELRG